MSASNGEMTTATCAGSISGGSWKHIDFPLPAQRALRFAADVASIPSQRHTCRSDDKAVSTLDNCADGASLKRLQDCVAEIIVVWIASSPLRVTTTHARTQLRGWRDTLEKRRRIGPRQTRTLVSESRTRVSGDQLRRRRHPLPMPSGPQKHSLAPVQSAWHVGSHLTRTRNRHQSHLRRSSTRHLRCCSSACSNRNTDTNDYCTYYT